MGYNEQNSPDLTAEHREQLNQELEYVADLKNVIGTDLRQMMNVLPGLVERVLKVNDPILLDGCTRLIENSIHIQDPKTRSQYFLKLRTDSFEIALNFQSLFYAQQANIVLIATGGNGLEVNAQRFVNSIPLLHGLLPRREIVDAKGIMYNGGKLISQYVQAESVFRDALGL